MMAVTRLISAAQNLGKSAWQPLLSYVAELHARSTHPPQDPFPYEWEEIGPGYCYGPAFGHWDLIHQVFDALVAAPEHARRQLLNDLVNQTSEGLIPGSIWMPRKDDPQRQTPRWSATVGHPPAWASAAQQYMEQVPEDEEFLRTCYQAATRQLAWFEDARHAEPQGFYYTDILSHQWESGIDEGVRFDNVQTGPFACVDATSHVYALYDFAARWAERLPDASADTGQEFAMRATELRAFIQNALFDAETGFFHDVWAVNQPEQRPMALDGMWPMVVGAATAEQAQRVIDENLLNPERFLTPHPLATVGINDPAFELRMWRGPTWNSMTYWAARGCRRYDRDDAAHLLVERALDASAAQFARTGTVWEFYSPFGDDPDTLQRKPQTPYNAPCPDYLGHNPLLAMAQLWEETKERS